MADTISPGLLLQLRSLEAVVPVNEAEVETKLLLHIFRLLGYSDSDRADKPPVTMYFGREKKTKFPDFLLYDGIERSLNNALVTVEAKEPRESVEDAIPQATSYAIWAGTPFFVTCNGHSLRVVYFIAASGESRVMEVDVSQLSNHWLELESFLSRASAILAKERLAYTALYLPEIEKLPPREFFQEYLTRLSQRYSADAPKQSLLLDFSDAHRHVPRIPVTVRLVTEGTDTLDDVGLTAIARRDRTRILVVGSAGSGKSTLVGRIATAAAIAGAHAPALLPIVVRLSNAIPASIADAFAVTCRDIGIRVLPTLYRQPLEKSHIVLLLDGFDEVTWSDDGRQRIRDLIEGCGNGAVIVTTRDFATEQAAEILPDHFATATVANLTEVQVHDVFHAYLGERADSVIAALPDVLRRDVGSPLMTLMVIRVAQSAPEWHSISRFRLFETYIDVLKDYFHSSRAGFGEKTSRDGALALVKTAASILEEGDAGTSLDLESLNSALIGQGHVRGVAPLLTIGLLTSRSGSAEFTHQSFLDFGLAACALDAIRSGKFSQFSSAPFSAGAYDFAHGELTSSEFAKLVDWLNIKNSAAHRRIYQLLRRGCPDTALSRVRKMWNTSGLMGQLEGTARILAANGDTEFLKGHERDIDGPKDTARARIFARVLSGYDGSAHVEVLLRLARSKGNKRYLIALVRHGLRFRSDAALTMVIDSYSRLDTRTRAAVLRAMTGFRLAAGFNGVLRALATLESDPENMLLLLNAAKNDLPALPDDLLKSASKTIDALQVTHPYQVALMQELFGVLQRSELASPGAGALTQSLAVHIKEDHRESC